MNYNFRELHIQMKTATPRDNRMFELMILLLLAVSSGCLVLLFATRSSVDLLDLAIFSFPVGTGLHVIILFFLNQFLDVPLTRPNLFSAMGVQFFLSCLFLVRRDGRRQIRQVYRPFGLWIRQRNGIQGFLEEILSLGPMQRFQVSALVVILVWSFGNAILNPSFVWDSFHYHLPIPREIFLTKSISKWADPTILGGMNALPPFQWILYGLSYIAADKETMLLPALLPFYCGLASLLIMFRVSRRFLQLPSSASLATLLLFFSEYSIAVMMMVENNDIVVSFFCLSAVYFLLRRYEQKQPRLLNAAAFMMALACWTKSLALLFFFSMGTSLFLMFLLNGRDHSRSLRVSFVDLCFLFFVTVGWIFPYFLRNWLLWGNPLYPGFGAFFGGYLLDDWAFRYPLAYMSPFKAIYPFTTKTFLGILRIGLIPVVFFCFYLFSRQWLKSRLELLLALTALLYFGILVVTMANADNLELSRYLIPSHFLFCVLAGPAYQAFLEGRLYPKGLNLLLLGGFLAYHLFIQAAVQLFVQLQTTGFVASHLAILCVVAIPAVLSVAPPLKERILRARDSLGVSCLGLAVSLAGFFLLLRSNPEGLVASLAGTGEKIVRSGLLLVPLISTARLFLLELVGFIGIVSLAHVVLLSLQRSPLRSLDRLIRAPGPYLVVFLVLLYVVPSVPNLLDGVSMHPDRIGTEKYKRWLGPEVDWMREHLSETDRILTFVSWRYFIPARVVRPDNPLLKRLYSAEITLEESVDLLMQFQVEYVYLNDSHTRLMLLRHPLAPLFFDSVLIRNLDDPRFFEKVYDVFDSRFRSRNRIYQLKPVTMGTPHLSDVAGPGRRVACLRAPEGHQDSLPIRHRQ